ncbi:MAG: hypothetical protein ACI39U_01165 [Candidatus Cryptobacteroides sp.]
MKGRFFGLLICASVLLFSCEKGPSTETRPEKDENGNLIYQGSDPDCFEFPMNAAEGDYNANENGVSIKIDKVDLKNVVFTLIPGESVKSYRLDIYPKAILYNYFLESDLLDADSDTIEDYIINLLTSSQGAGGYIFDYVTNAEDFAMKQFDWMNSNYAQYKIVPDCDYFVTVVGFYDEDAVQPASLSVSHFKTTTQALVGTPSIGLSYQAGYRAFRVEYIPNADCKYFYNWAYLSKEIDEYINLFGETMMRDFMRCAVSAALDVSDETNLSTYVGFDQAPEEVSEYAVVAIALDANQIPADHITRLDFTLREIPEDAELGVASVEINDKRVSATAVWFDVTVSKEAQVAYYNVVTESEATSIMEADESVRKQYASETLAAGGAYGVKNENYLFDTDTEKPVGSSYTAKNEFMIDLIPNQSYQVIYCVRNIFGELSDLMVSDVFTTKSLDFDHPENCLCNDDFKFELRDASRTGWVYYAEYDWDDMAVLRFQVVYPDVVDSPYMGPDNPGTREELLNHLFGASIANVWWALPDGVDRLGYFGYTSGTEYVVAYCVEDINGVVGPVGFATVDTKEVKPGANPTMEIEATISDDGKTLDCRFISNEDSKLIKHYASTVGGSYNDLGLHKLLDDPRGEYEYSDFLRIWRNYAIEYGLLSYDVQAIDNYELDPDSDYFLLVGAIAIGEDNGEDCYSPFVYKLYYKGEFHDLSEYRTPPAKNN